MFIFVYSDFESFFRTYFALVILLSSDFCFSLLYLYPTVLSEQKKRSRLRSGNAFGLFFALSFSLYIKSGTAERCRCAPALSFGGIK
jgi:hypothetical protein